MAINWKLRDNVFRLLAAVYAELGETAVSVQDGHEADPLAELIDCQFKGRYASIAKFYGSDATYDAVKSFFAKEITRAAEELQHQNPGHQRSNRTMVQKSTSSRSSRRTLHLDFNDQDISFVSEREVEAHSRHALQRPPKRPRVYAPSQTPDQNIRVVENLDDDLAAPVRNGFQPINAQPSPALPPMNGNLNEIDRTQEGHAIFQAGGQETNEQRELTSHSDDPSYMPSPSPVFQPPPRPRAAPKKRPYKAVAEYDLEYQTVSSSSNTEFQTTQAPASFGYVTNAGFFRCALCFSQLSSQEALDNHEALSKLHLRNLQNPLIVSKGRAKLAQVTALPYQSSASPAAFRPLRPDRFGDREQHLIYGHGLQGSPATLCNPQESRDQHNNIDPSLTRDTIEVASQQESLSAPQIDSGVGNSSMSQISEFEQQAGRPMDKGKQRAASYPAVEPHRMEVRTDGLPQSRPANEHYREPEPPTISEHQTVDSRAGDKPQTSKAPSRLRPLEVAEILRLTGIRLAEKYIAEHPDLIAQTMGRVQREFTAASASVNGSIGAASVEPPEKGRDAGRGNNGSRREADSQMSRGRMGAPDVVVLD